MAGINLEKSNILIRNYGIIDISFGHIIFIANTVNYDRMDSYLYYNLFNSIIYIIIYLTQLQLVLQKQKH